MNVWPSKDPNEVLDYQLDWSDRLISGETIATSAWSLVSGDVVIAGSPAPSISVGVTTVWLTGGTDGTVSVVLNRIVTSQGRTYDESTKLRIRSH